MIPNKQPDDRLAAFVDGYMSERERDRFVAELRVNPQLRKDLDEYKRTVETVRKALQAPTAAVDVAGRVMAQIASDRESGIGLEGIERPGRRYRLFVSTAAAAALLVLAVWLNSLPKGWSVGEPTTDTVAGAEAAPVMTEAGVAVDNKRVDNKRVDNKRVDNKRVDKKAEHEALRMRSGVSEGQIKGLEELESDATVLFSANPTGAAEPPVEASEVLAVSSSVDPENDPDKLRPKSQQANLEQWNVDRVDDAGKPDAAKPGAVKPGAVKPGAVKPGAVKPGGVKADAGRPTPQKAAAVTAETLRALEESIRKSTRKDDLNGLGEGASATVLNQPEPTATAQADTAGVAPRVGATASGLVTLERAEKQRTLGVATQSKPSSKPSSKSGSKLGSKPTKKVTKKPDQAGSVSTASDDFYFIGARRAEKRSGEKRRLVKSKNAETLTGDQKGTQEAKDDTRLGRESRLVEFAKVEQSTTGKFVTLPFVRVTRYRSVVPRRAGSGAQPVAGGTAVSESEPNARRRQRQAPAVERARPKPPGSSPGLAGLGTLSPPKASAPATPQGPSTGGPTTPGSANSGAGFVRGRARRDRLAAFVIEQLRVPRVPQSVPLDAKPPVSGRRTEGGKLVLGGVHFEDITARIGVNRDRALGFDAAPVEERLWMVEGKKSEVQLVIRRIAQLARAAGYGIGNGEIAVPRSELLDRAPKELAESGKPQPKPADSQERGRESRTRSSRDGADKVADRVQVILRFRSQPQ